MPAEFPTLKIRAPGATLSRATVELDGFEVPALTGLSLDMAPGEANEVTLKILVEDVEVDAEVLAALEAKVAEEE